MRCWVAWAAAGLGLAAAVQCARAEVCQDGKGGLGVARIVEIDTTGGPVFGSLTKRPREKSFLGPKEVVLTFDDGPMPGVTRSILETLDRFCTKATFFSVGRMAVAYPDLVREILKRGHTLGTHTWSHPMNLPRLKGRQAIDQIESGFAAVALAAGQPIAPFFRFPGLSDSAALVRHLEERGIATFTVDVVSNDSYIADPERLVERTLMQLAAESGGIALFHDIKPQTAKALPKLLAEMKARGYRIVHMRAKAPFEKDESYDTALRAHLARVSPLATRRLIAVTEAPVAPAPAVSPPDAREPAATATMAGDGEDVLQIAGDPKAGQGDAVVMQPVLKAALGDAAATRASVGTDADSVRSRTRRAVIARRHAANQQDAAVSASQADLRGRANQQGVLPVGRAAAGRAKQTAVPPPAGLTASGVAEPREARIESSGPHTVSKPPPLRSSLRPEPSWSERLVEETGRTGN